MAAGSTSPPNPTDRVSIVETRLDAIAGELEAVGTHIAQIRSSVEREHRGLDARLSRFEGQMSAAPAPLPWHRRVPWGAIPPWLQAIATPIVVALVAWWLTGSLDLAIKQQQADISGVKEMRDALEDLYAPVPEKSAVETAALSIAAFGGIASGPLVEAINRGGAARVPAAERGLVAAAALDKERVCSVLESVNGSSERLYRQETRDVAQRLRGDLQC